MIAQCTKELGVILVLGAGVCLQGCRSPNPPVFRVTVPADYQGALLLVVDQDCVREGYVPTDLNFSESPLLCVPSLDPFAGWHTFDAKDVNGRPYAFSTADTMQPGSQVIIEMGSVSGSRLPKMLKLYVGDPAHAHAAFDVLSEVSFDTIRQDPWLLQLD